MTGYHLKKQLFYQVVEALEEKISVSAYYTVELACQRINIKPEELTQEKIPELINSIIDIYKDYYPHRVKDIKEHLEKRLIYEYEFKPKRKRRRFFRFF